jgi:predicted CXXCH cytochrome family protein
MAQSSGKVGPSTSVETFVSAEVAGVAHTAKYRVSKTPTGASFTFQQDNTSGTRRLDYYIGSGVVGRSYAMAVGRFLFQAPVSFYTSAARWELSPGFEKSTEVVLTRPVEPTCLRCHASGIQDVPGTVNGYQEPAFVEGGISCERCHGPGQTHLREMKLGARSANPAIVNPAKLDPQRRDSICAQCHLAGASEIGKQRSVAEFRPGDVFSEYVAVFQWNTPDAGLAVNSHFERMTQSTCRKAAGPKLWCGSCHDPHSVPSQENKVAYFRDRCFQCHDGSSCALPIVERTKAGDDCVKCHMPRTGARTVKHAAFTDHSIPRFNVKSTPGLAVPPDAVLLPLSGIPSSDRELGLAYANVAIEKNNKVWGMRAFELLRKAAEMNPDDARVASQLAQLYDRMGNERKACELYAQAVRSEPASVAAKVNLGTCMAKEGRVTESIELWSDVVARAPGLESARFNLAVAQYRSGDAAAARRTLREALAINPTSRRAVQLMRQLDVQGPH